MITFISLNKKFIELAKNKGLNAHICRIEKYKPIKPIVFYVVQSDMLGSMDNHINLELYNIVFPNIEETVKTNIKKYGKTTLLDQRYLPVGSSIINETEKKNSYLVSTPIVMLSTLFSEKDISKTSNSYFATVAALYNVYINCEYIDDDIEIIFTSMCCGWGKMSEEESLSQIMDGIETYENYTPVCTDKCVLLEPNFDEQMTY